MLTASHFRTLGLMALTCTSLTLSACGWFDGVGADAQPKQNAALTLDDTVRLGMGSFDAATAAIVPATFAPAADGWTTLNNGLRRVQSTMGRPDDAAAWGHTQSIRKAFILAGGAQDLRAEIHAALATAPQATGVDTLNSFAERLTAGHDDLTTLLQIPQDQPIALNTAPINLPTAIPSLDTLELLALQNRAELRMEMDHAADAEALRASALSRFPGVDKLLKSTPDQTQWSAFANSYTQSLIRLYTMPLQMKDDRTRALLTSLRQDSLTAAILAQVHMAHQRFQSAAQTSAAAHAILDRVQDRAAATPEQNRIDTLNARAGIVLTQAQLHVAYADLMRTIGMGEQIPSLPDQNPMLQNASFVENTALPTAYIPFAEKISGQQGQDAEIMSRSMGEPKMLNITGSQMKKLLDAPISEP